jgi:hypothetical protein
MDYEHERSRMTEARNELASLICSLNLGSVETPIEEYVQLVREEIVDAKYSMVELVNLARGKEIHLGLDLNEEPIKGNDVDDQATPIIKLPQAYENANYYHIL